MGHSHGTVWNDDLIAAQLGPIIDQLGHMPSSKELSAMGRNDLSCIISRRGGYAAWRERMNAAQRGSCSSVGSHAQTLALHMLQERGLSVEEMVHKAPYDILVNGKVRVDVKSARFSRVVGSSRVWTDKSAAPGGYVFGLTKVPPTCDMYLMAPLDEQGDPMEWLFIPSAAAQVQTITLTTLGNCKYDRYRGAFHELERLLRE